RIESRYGESLFQLRRLGKIIARVAPIAAARRRRTSRPPTGRPAQYALEASRGSASTTADAATASHAARERVSTSAAATTATPADPTNAPADRRAATVA